MFKIGDRVRTITTKQEGTIVRCNPINTNRSEHYSVRFDNGDYSNFYATSLELVGPKETTESYV